MLSNFKSLPRFATAYFIALLTITAGAQTLSPAQTPHLRKDRIFLKDVEGIWINESYVSVLAQLKSPHAAARKTPPVVIAIRREGRAYPIVVTDFNRASLQAVLDVEPDGSPGAYRLVVAADDRPTSSKDVKYIRFKAAKNAQGKLDRLRVAEPDFMKGKWADYIPIEGEMNPHINRLVIAGNYRDEKGQNWTFSESGEAIWPEQKFSYELSLNDPGANCDYLQGESLAKSTDGNGGADNKKRYGYGWKAGKLSIFAAHMAGKKVVCAAKPLAVLTPQ
jgi:hypothetical protein